MTNEKRPIMTYEDPAVMLRDLRARVEAIWDSL